MKKYRISEQRHGPAWKGLETVMRNQQFTHIAGTKYFDAHQFRCNHDGMDAIRTNTSNPLKPRYALSTRFHVAAIQSEIPYRAARFDPTDNKSLCALLILHRDIGRTVNPSLL